MKVIDIAKQSGAKVRTVRSWIAKAAKQSASIRKKGMDARKNGKREPADYNKGETILILSFKGGVRKSAKKPVKKAKK